jgi:hypothetical protein
MWRVPEVTIAGLTPGSSSFKRAFRRIPARYIFSNYVPHSTDVLAVAVVPMVVPTGALLAGADWRSTPLTRWNDNGQR